MPDVSNVSTANKSLKLGVHYLELAAYHLSEEYGASHISIDYIWRMASHSKQILLQEQMKKEQRKKEEVNHPMVSSLRPFAEELNKEKFWKNYHTARRSLSYDTWERVKGLFLSNPNYIEWITANS